mgnify:CR=1 FL=1
MECASCGKRVGGVSVIVGIVRVTTHKCSCCGKVWRDKELTVPFSVPVLESEVSRLKATPGTKSPVVRVSIRFLTGKLEHHSLQGLDPEASLRRRRDANWERQFLKSMLGEDYL